jgi:hypothetical protein
MYRIMQGTRRNVTVRGNNTHGWKNTCTVSEQVPLVKLKCNCTNSTPNTPTGKVGLEAANFFAFSLWRVYNKYAHQKPEQRAT